jgi:hypothetical protein
MLLMSWFLYETTQLSLPEGSPKAHRADRADPRLAALVFWEYCREFA